MTMRNERLVYKIERRELSPDRKNLIAKKEAIKIGSPLKIVLVAGGAYLFFLGIDGVPPGMEYMAIVFACLGIAAVLVAIFIQWFFNTRYISKASKVGAFPEEVAISEGGFHIREAVKKAGEKIIPFSRIGNVFEEEEYFRVILLDGSVSDIFLFKEDFREGDPEAFKDYLDSKK